MQVEDKKLSLIIDISTFNTIIAGLEELPHKFSRKVIDDLSKQVQEQVQQTQQFN